MQVPFLRLLASVLVASLCMALMGCPQSAQLARSFADLPPIQGRADFAGMPLRTQATVGEVANAATVSLIDPGSGYATVVTTLTDASGTFLLNKFPLTFKPGPDPYVLEAVKGLSAGGTSNRAGASAARVRTLVKWTGTEWRSISQGSVTVSVTTTALSIIASLRGLAPAATVKLIDGLQMGTSDGTAPDTLSGLAASGSGISVADYDTVWGLASNALTLDQDPVQVVTWTGSIYKRLDPSANLIRIIPSVAYANASIILVGAGFSATPANNVVTFPGGATAVGTAVSPDRTQLTVTVPSGASSGPLTVGTTTGTVLTQGGFFRYATSPLAGTRFVGLNTGTRSGDSGPFVRIIATQANTKVVLRSLNAAGSMDYVLSQTLPTVGSFWEPNLADDAISAFQLTSDKPIFASYDDLNAPHGSDDEWGCQTGTDYYFRVPGTYGGFYLISHASGNTVTVKCLTDDAQTVTPTLAEGGSYGRSSMPGAYTSYWYRVTSSSPTTVVYGLFADNASTQVFSADMKTYYAAHLVAGASKQGSYTFVGYENGTNVSVTDYVAGTTQSYALQAGQTMRVNYPVLGNVVQRLKVVASAPIGFYVRDYNPNCDFNQHSSVDVLGSLGSLYRIVQQADSATSVYVVSLVSSNSVSVSGGLTGTHALEEFAWKDLGALASGSVATIQSTTGPVAVFTSSALTSENSYTLVPY